MIQSISRASIVVSCLIAASLCVTNGCRRQSPQQARVEVPAAPQRWTQPTENGQLKIGNAFPDVGDPVTVAGKKWDGFQKGQRYVVIVGSDQYAQRTANIDWLRTIISQHAENYHFIMTSEDADPDRWTSLLESIDTLPIRVLHADSFRSDEVGEALLWPSGSSGMPRVFIVGNDMHIEWIGDIDADKDRIDFNRVLVDVASDRWDRERENEPFEKKVADYRNGHRMHVAVQLAINTEEYDDAIEILRGDLGDDPDFVAAQRSQLRYIAKRANRHDVLNEVIAAEAEANSEDAEWLAEAAFKLATGEEGDDKVLATRLAKQSCEQTEYEDPRMLYALAVTYSVRSNVDEANQWAIQAMEIAEDKELRAAAKELIIELPEQLEDEPADEDVERAPHAPSNATETDALRSRS